MSKEGYLPALHAASDVLQLSLDLDQIIYTTLTAITAGESFGFNRAFFLFVNPKADRIWGYFGIGPRDEAEATRVWQEMRNKGVTLEDLIRNYDQEVFETEKEKFHDKLSLLDFRISELKRRKSPIYKCIQEKKAIHVRGAFQREDVDPELVEALEVDEFALVPLVNPKREVGIIIVDNFITKKRIDPEDIVALETFARQASLAISRALLVRKLEEKVRILEESGRMIKSYQRKILEMEKMATTGELVHHLAHEIKNPLVVIGGLVNALLDETREDDPRHPYLKAVVEEVQKLENILVQVVKGIKAQAMGEVRAVDINDFVYRKLEEMNKYLEANRIRCKIELEGSIPRIKVSPEKLDKVLEYIVGNAIEAMGSGGVLGIKTFQEGEEVVIAISDTGPGISSEIIDRIFEPFFSTKAGGTGLGLYNSMQLIRSMGGTIEVESKSGCGTTFYIKLPLDQEV